MLRATFTEANLGPGVWIATLLPILGWSLIAAGLSQRASAIPSVHSPATHALRDPR